MKIIARILGGLFIFALVILILAPIVFFSIPELKLNSAQVRNLLDRYLPSSIVITYKSLDFQMTHVSGETFAKHLVLKADDLCVRYNDRAIDSCFSKTKFGLTFGWGGARPHGETWLFPRLISIDPIELLEGSVNADLAAFPPSTSSPKSFDFVNFLRKQILPKWTITGSRIEIKKSVLLLDKTPGESVQKSLNASFDLFTDSLGEIKAELHDFRVDGSPLRAHAELSLQRPEGSKVRLPAANDKLGWKLLLDGVLAFDKKADVQLKADADIESWQALAFHVNSVWHGVDFLRSLNLDGDLKKDKVNGRVSLDSDDRGARKKLRNFRALSLVKCLFDADLEKKILDLGCGPQTVRVRLEQKEFVKDPAFFTLAPEFKLRATIVEFGDVKKADFALDLKVDHFGILKADTTLKGSVKSSPKESLHYSVNGDLNFLVSKFGRVTALLKDTPFAAPAPLNVLKGPVELKTKLNLNESGGDVIYQASTRLDSDAAHAQSMHVRVDGKTTLAKTDAGMFHPSSDVTVFIDELHLAAPRFDLRKPPTFKPDPRFKKGKPAPLEDEDQSLAANLPQDIRVHIKTTAPQAIQIATNLTKSAVPIDLDLFYGKPLTRNENLVTGTVVVGRTAIDLFRRNAVIDHFRFDLLATGEQRVDGRVSVSYLDYDIRILLMGNLKEPIVKLESQPPVDDNQIIAVLLFGRPMNELSQDQQTSVSSLNAAVADAALSISSLYLLASTPIQSVGYDPMRGMVSARVGLGGGASLELGSGKDTASAVGFQKRLNKDFTFRTEVDTLTTTGKRTVTALIEWVKRF